jgi:hypothetical protein
MFDYDWNPFKDPHYDGNPRWNENEWWGESWDDEWLEKVKARIIQRFPKMTSDDAEAWLIGMTLMQCLSEENKDAITFSLSKSDTDEKGTLFRFFCPDDSCPGTDGMSLVKAVLREP